MRSQNVFHVDEIGVAAGLDRRLLGCPFLLDTEGDLNDVNDYLEALYLGDWPNGKSRGGRSRRRVFRWMPSSISAVASRLLNAASWCRNPQMHLGTKPDLLSANEADLDRYAQQQEAGLWSRDGASLRPSTIGSRQLALIDFREWAAAVGRAPPLELRLCHSTRSAPTQGGGYLQTEASRPLVLRRPNPTVVCFPSVDAARTALANFDDVGLLLAAKLVLFCGLRRAEVVSIRVSDVIQASAGSQQFIRCVGKGRKERRIEIDSDLLQQIRDYIEFERPIRLARSGLSTDCLLINWRTGRPYISRAIWKAFKASGMGVSPHLGRHWYAVHYLLRAWKREQRAAAEAGNVISKDLMSAVLSTDILRLQLNLGHADYKTTLKYLVALGQYVDIDGLTVSFQDYLGKSDDED